MTTREMVTQIIRDRDAKSARRLASMMSRIHDMNYRELYEWVNNIHPIPLPDWDELLREGE